MSAPKYWREIPQRYRFEAIKCKKCGKVMFPPRLACPACPYADKEILGVDQGEFKGLTTYSSGWARANEQFGILCEEEGAAFQAGSGVSIDRAAVNTAGRTEAVPVDASAAAQLFKEFRRQGCMPFGRHIAQGVFQRQGHVFLAQV